MEGDEGAEVGDGFGDLDTVDFVSTTVLQPNMAQYQSNAARSAVNQPPPFGIPLRDPWNEREIVYREFSGSCEAPPGFAMDLKKHQKVALRWMMDREVRPLAQEPEGLRGGILADDMGLGKTVETLALIAVDRVSPQLLRFDANIPSVKVQERHDLSIGQNVPSYSSMLLGISAAPKKAPSKKRSVATWHCPASATSTLFCFFLGCPDSFVMPTTFDQRLPVIHATLIVCPKGVLNHWYRESTRCMERGSKFRVMVLHPGLSGAQVGAPSRPLASVHAVSWDDFGIPCRLAIPSSPSHGSQSSLFSVFVAAEGAVPAGGVAVPPLGDRRHAPVRYLPYDLQHRAHAERGARTVDQGHARRTCRP